MDAYKRSKKRFGRRIKKLREAGLQVPQETLAEELGVSSVYLSRLERGASSPSFNLLVRISSVMKLSLSELFQDV